MKMLCCKIRIHNYVIYVNSVLIRDHSITATKSWISIYFSDNCGWSTITRYINRKLVIYYIVQPTNSVTNEKERKEKMENIETLRKARN